MNKIRILTVDDELSIVKFLRASLEGRGYQVLAAMNGAEALQIIEKESPDLIISDITMPEVDGFEVCRRLREWSQVPIIMLSARADESDKVKCLELGADDYMTKPCGVDELTARVQAVLRRTKATRSAPALPAFTCDDVQINFAERRVAVAGQEVKLTPTEYNLLRELVLNANKVLTHSMLLAKIWGPEYRDEREYLHVFARRLRRKLESEPAKPRHIISVSGVGYKFKT